MKQLFSDLELKAGQGGETCEKETKEVSPSITLAFCPEAHARPQGRKRDAKENTAASQSLENMRWWEAVVAQASKEGSLCRNRVPKICPRAPLHHCWPQDAGVDTDIPCLAKSDWKAVSWTVLRIFTQLRITRVTKIRVECPRPSVPTFSGNPKRHIPCKVWLQFPCAKAILILL